MQPAPPISDESAEPTLACKCCGSVAVYFGTVDFNRGCLDPTPVEQAPVQIPVRYHRCVQCGFLFTAAFDRFSPDDFRKFIYNHDYIRFDPDYLETRPRHNADFVGGLFRESPHLRILDYGGGSGRLATLLRSRGFQRVETFDPFVAEHRNLPAGRFDLVLSFEVVEHAPDPRMLFIELIERVADEGLILFTTAFQPPDIARLGVGWWYIGPRNGHVSLYTPQSILSIVKPLGFRLASSPDGLVHLMFRSVPRFARHLNMAGPAS